MVDRQFMDIFTISATSPDSCCLSCAFRQITQFVAACFCSHVDNVIGTDLNGSDGNFGDGDDVDQVQKCTDYTYGSD